MRARVHLAVGEVLAAVGVEPRPAGDVDRQVGVGGDDPQLAELAPADRRPPADRRSASASTRPDRRRRGGRRSTRSPPSRCSDMPASCADAWQGKSVPHQRFSPCELALGETSVERLGRGRAQRQVVRRHLAMYARFSLAQIESILSGSSTSRWSSGVTWPSWACGGLAPAGQRRPTRARPAGPRGRPARVTDLHDLDHERLGDRRGVAPSPDPAGCTSSEYRHSRSARV